MSDMEWTELTPTEPGAYWVVTRFEREPYLVEVHDAFGGMQVDRHGLSQPLSPWAMDVRPLWFGPFKCPPAEIAEERSRRAIAEDQARRAAVDPDFAERMRAIEAAIDSMREQERRLARAAETRERLARLSGLLSRASRDLHETARVVRAALGAN